LANSRRARWILSGSAPGGPSFLRTLPALLTNLPSRASLAGVASFGGSHVRQSYSIKLAFACVPVAEANLTHPRAHPLTCADVKFARRVTYRQA
jgi:hypothetical protein